MWRVVAEKTLSLMRECERHNGNGSDFTMKSGIPTITTSLPDHPFSDMHHPSTFSALFPPLQSSTRT